MFLKYVGKQPRKTDNILKTATVWSEPGDIQEVPDPVGLRLKQYEDVWQECDKDGNPKDTPPPGHPSKIVTVDLDSIADDPAALREYARQRFGFDIDRRIKRADKMLEMITEWETTMAMESNTKQPEIYNGVLVTEDLAPLLPMAMAGGFSNDPEQAVMQAIDMLGGPGSEYYDPQTSIPKLNAVKLLAGEFVTEELIDRVIAESHSLDEEARQSSEEANAE